MKSQDEAIIYALCEGEIRNNRIWVEEKCERTLCVTVGGFEADGLKGLEAVAYLEDRISSWEEELNRYGKPYAVGVLAREVISIVKGNPTEVIGDNWIYLKQVDGMTVYYVPFSNMLVFRLNKDDYLIIGTEQVWDIGTCSFNVYAAIAKVLAADEKQHLSEVLYAYCCRNIEGTDSRTCFEITSMLDKVLNTGEKEKIIQKACRLL